MRPRTEAELEKLEQIADKLGGQGYESLEDAPATALLAKEWRFLARIHNENSRYYLEEYFRIREQKEELERDLAEVGDSSDGSPYLAIAELETIIERLRSLRDHVADVAVSKGKDARGYSLGFSSGLTIASILVREKLEALSGTLQLDLGLDKIDLPKPGEGN
jgi:hypothetical protein